MAFHSFGEIVLINFPFTDGRGAKKRPALSLLDSRDGDILVARITSHKYRTKYDIDVTHWQNSGLLKPSVVRIHKLATLNTTNIDRTLGKLNTKDQKKVKSIFKRLVD